MTLVQWKMIIVLAMIASCNFVHGCLRTYSGSQGIIESDNYPNQYSTGYSCKYIVKGDHGNKILLEFDGFDLEYTPRCTKDYLEFRERGEMPKRKCGNDMTPYISKSNRLTFTFVSDGSITGKGFRIRYKTCGGDHAESFKFNIISLGYGISFYPNNTDCTHTMTSIYSYGFKLVFNDFHLENSTGCKNDSLSIYDTATSDSTLIAKRCGENDSELISTSSNLKAQFVTNALVSNVGFNVSVYACYRLMTTDRGTISSPDYPNSCEINALCLYDIRLPAGSKIKLEFEELSFYGNDYLRLQSSSNPQDVILKNITNSTDVEIQEFGNQIYLELWCDVLPHFISRHTFRMFYYDNQGSCSKYKPCQNGGNCTDIIKRNWTYNCTCTLDYEGKNCSNRILACESNPCLNNGSCADIPSRGLQPPTFRCTCPSNFTGDRCEILVGMLQVYSNSQGVIMSKNYPLKYPTLYICRYIIQALYGNKILLEFDDFDLEQSPGCTKDFLEITESGKGENHTSKRCGNDTRLYVSSTGEISLYFSSNRNGTGKGFRIRYKTCGGDYKNLYRYDITSPSYGVSQYPSNSDCKYNMKSVRNFGFKLVFNVFDLENSTGCENDSLSVYNGAISDSNLITKRCGKQTPDLLSTTSQLTAQFLSNYLVSGVGFRVSVYACYRLMTTDRGTISSPYYPSTCNSSALCLYHIRLPVGSKLKLEFQGFRLSGSNYLQIQNSSNALDANFRRVTNVAGVESEEYGNQIKLELWCNPPSSGFRLFYYDNQGACSKHHPCQNGGTCTDINTKSMTYRCTCLLDYEGKNCDKRVTPCESNPCLNNGACENIPSRGNQLPTFKCSCDGYYGGQRCETLLGACRKNNPCQNGGQCFDINKVSGTYRCTCKMDYKGKNCSQLIIPCESSPCLNEGTCTDIRSINNMPPTFKCDCIEEYKGTTCEHFIDGCKEYRNDSRWQRSISHNASTTFCDSALQFSWYRFISNAGPDMPTVCPDQNSCGSIGSIWINETVELETGNETDLVACARNSTSCCSESWDIRIKKCQEMNGTTFNVYRLRKPPSCPMAYCAGTELPCPPKYNSINGFSPNCTEIHPQILEAPRLHVDVESNQLVFKCEFKSDTVEDAARFEVSWYEEFPLKQLSKIETLEGRERIAKLLVNHSISTGPSISILGKTIFCKVYGWYEDRPYGRVNGPVKESNHFFAGIKVEPNRQFHTITESDKPIKLTVRVTVPIICSIGNSCRVLVDMNTDTPDGLLDVCMLEFKPGPANQSQFVQIIAKRDFVRDGTNVMRIRLKVIKKDGADGWDIHHPIPYVVVKIYDVNTARCSSTGDPHLTTYDGLYFHHYRVGTYILTKSNCREFEVHVRTDKCYAVSCNCGVAAREGNDVIVVDFCKGAIQTARFASQGIPANGTQLLRDRTGKNFIIKFPSGSYVEFNTYFYYGKTFANIYVQVASDDSTCTVGLCGTFDGRRANDFKDKSGLEYNARYNSIAPGSFSESWRLDSKNNLFNYKDNGTRFDPPKSYCNCISSPSGRSISKCDYISARPSSMDNSKGWTRLVPQIVVTTIQQHPNTLPLPKSDPETDYDFKPDEPPGIVPGWPTASGRTKQKVEEYCNSVVRNSTSGQICSIIPDFPIAQYVEQCITDIQVTDTTDFTISAIQSMQIACEEIFMKNTTFWKPNVENGSILEPPTDLQMQMCPGLCSGNGMCINATCKCNSQFIADDCSVDKKSPPIIDVVGSGGLCDIRKRSDCHIVKVAGKNFVENENLACSTSKLKITENNYTIESKRRIHNASLLSFKELLCSITSHITRIRHSSGRYPSGGYMIEVTNNGVIFSKARATYIIFDSSCMECNGTVPSCKHKANTCSIDNFCYTIGETSKSDPYAICNPAISQSQFTKEHYPKIRSGPHLSPLVKDMKIALKCQFETEKDEEAARFEVTWFEASSFRQINETQILNGLERYAILQDGPDDVPLFSLGMTIFCRIRTWYINQSIENIPGPYHNSSHYYVGIKVEPKKQVHLISESGKPLKLTVRVTVPIICSVGNSCLILIDMTTSNLDGLLDVCMLEFKPGPANQTQIVHFAAKRDFVLDGNNLVRIKLKVMRKGDPVGWGVNYTIADVLVKIIDVNTARCQSSGDPHLTTYDGLYFDHYRSGTYLLTKSNCREFEVHVRTDKCNAVSCNCGVAAREGNDVIVVDFCKGAIQTARFASQGVPANGTQLLRDGTGKNFIIKFPSGSFVEFNTFPYAGKTFANIMVQVPSDDFQCTIGLCGTFDGNQLNDFKDRSGREHSSVQYFPAPAGFTESWRLDSNNLFNYKATGNRVLPPKRFCSCASSPSGGSIAICDYISAKSSYMDDSNGLIRLLPPIAKHGIHSTGGNGILILPPIDIHTTYDFNPDVTTGIIPDWPLASGRTKKEVEDYCHQKIGNFTSGRICSVISDFSIHQYVQQCIMDIRVTDTDSFTISAIQSMLFACEETVLKNMSYWKPNKQRNGTLEAPKDLRKDMCPGMCSNKGICINSTCSCDEDFTGDDCSVNKTMPPNIESLASNGLCDVQKRNDCHIVRVRGSGYLANDKLACLTTKISSKNYTVTHDRRLHKANLLSFKEIFCNIGSHIDGLNQPSYRDSTNGYIIQVTNNGKSFSSAVIPYIIYDSKCMKCNATIPSCKPKENTCSIDNVCYMSGEASRFDSYFICNPTISQTRFTKEHYPKIRSQLLLSPVVRNKKIAFKCEFETEKDEEAARFEVTWFEASPLRQINETQILSGLERNATIQDRPDGASLFSLGMTIFCRIRSWYINQSIDSIPGPYQNSSHYYVGIKVEPSKQVHTISESGKPLKLTVRVTVPIICNVGNSCRVLVEMNTGNLDGLLDVCMLEFKPGPANQTRIVQFAAKRDFVLDGSNLVRLKLRIIRKGDLIGWNVNYTIPDVMINVIDVNTARCQSTGDPHLTTYDGLNFDHYKSGTYLLTKSNCREFEVHVRTDRCNSVSCNCGVAAREGNDVIVVDFCKGAIQTARFASQGFPANGTQLLRDGTGKNFVIKFPSGSFVEFNSFPFAGKMFANIIVQVPSDDFQCTVGLCGTFDGNRLNDFKDRSSREHSTVQYLPAPALFTESWRLDSNNLFNYKDTGGRVHTPKRFCSCTSSPSGGSVAKCDYISAKPSHMDDSNGLIRLLPPIAIQDNYPAGNNGILILPPIHTHTTYEFNPGVTTGIIPGWPLASGRTKKEVEEYCYQKMRNSTSARICSIIPDFEVHQYVAQCITDIRVTDTDYFTISAIQSMQYACEEIILKNMSYWKPNMDKNGTLEPPKNLRKDMCPGMCSNNGICINSTCYCYEGFTGDDCSVNKTMPPSIESLASNGLCDVQKRNDCHIVRIIGSGFLANDKLSCMTTKLKISEANYTMMHSSRLHKASLLSFKEVFCNIGAHVDGLNQPSYKDATNAYNVEVANDGKIFSSVLTPYIIYDSRCMECNATIPSCKPKDYTCSINNVCYMRGDTSKVDPYAVCNPSISQSQFTKEHYPKIRNGLHLSPFVKNNKIAFKCEFETEKDEEAARFEVTWFEASPLRQINETQILSGLERNATLQDRSDGAPLFSLGMTVEPNKQIHTISESDKPLKLKVIVTIPIVCKFGNSCRVLVDINTGSFDGLVDVCMLEFKPGQASQTQIVQFAAKRDFVLDGSNLVKLKFLVTKKGDPIGWDVHHKISDVIIKIMDVNTARCQSTGDPHLITYDGLYFDHYKAGTYLLTKSKCHDFEVHVRTDKCYAVSCNCGVAAREGNDVIVVDFCKGSMQTARFASKSIPANGTQLLRDSTGKKFVIKFPSGSFVEFNIFPYDGKFFANVIIQIPSDDFNCTVGLCGTFDGNRLNDFKDRSGREHSFIEYLPAPAIFTESWRLGSNNLFNYKGTGSREDPPKRFCSCPSSPSGGSIAKCDYISAKPSHMDDSNGLIRLLPPIAIQGNHPAGNNGILILPPIHKHIAYEFNPDVATGIIPGWPSASGRTKKEIQAYCEQALQNSTSWEICSIIPHFPINHYVQQCITDIQVTDTTFFTLSAIQSMQYACEEIILKNMSYWKPNMDKNGTLEPPKNLRKDMCPGMCSNNGICINSTCDCYEGFTGDDCSVNKTMPPSIESLASNGLCDVQKRNDCHIVRIIGSGFLANDKLSCMTTKLKISEANYTMTHRSLLHKASLLSFREVFCNIGAHVDGLNQPSYKDSTNAYNVEVANDGKIFSSALTPYIIYDSRCMECNATVPSCKPKENTCSINNVCYLSGEPAKSDPHAICNPAISQSEFTKEHFPKIRSGPHLSPILKNRRIAFKCEFTTEKDEETARFEVTWFEASPFRQINETNVLKGLERNAVLQDVSDRVPLFSVGITIFCRVRSWYTNTSLAKIPGPYRESSHYYVGMKIEPDKQVHTISESDKPIKLRVRVTVPIICKAGNSCRVLVDIYTDNSDGLLDVCILEFKPGPANQTQILQFAAKRDFVLDGSNLMRLKLKVTKKGDPVGWDVHHTIPDVIIKINDVDTARCQSTGDPHLTTYDGLYFDHYKVGTYLLTKSNCREFEVHVRTDRCNAVSCNCGVAAREGKDVIVLDFCKGAIQNVRFASQGMPANGTELLRDSTGKNFIIKFPSGSFVKFSAYSFAGKIVADVMVQIPSDDFNCTVGLCGTFDGSRLNDFKDRMGSEHSSAHYLTAPVEFTESWRLGSKDNLFNYVDSSSRIKPPMRFCSCASKTPGDSSTRCNYISRAQSSYMDNSIVWVRLLPPVAILEIQQGPTAAVILPKSDKEANYAFKPDQPTGKIPGWPTSTGRKKEQIERYCNDKIRNSSSGTICSIIPKFPLHQYVQQCMTDIQVTDTDYFTTSAIRAMQFACEEIFFKNMSYWKPNLNKNGILEPPSDLQREMCPGMCSGNGVCINATCKCNEKFTADDCSVKKESPPSIKSVGRDGICDLQKRNDCHIVRIIGSGFFENDNLECLSTRLKISEKGYLKTGYTRKHKASLLSFREVLCNIERNTFGASQLSTAYPTDGYLIEVTNDGHIYSNARATYVTYDSKCMECSNKPLSCKQKDGTCIISGQCSLPGEKRGKYKCDPNAKIGAPVARVSYEREVLIAVGCFVGVILVLAIASLVGIRRKQKEYQVKKKIENESLGAFELGKLNENIYSGNFDEKCGVSEEMVKRDMSENEEDTVLQMNGEENITVAIVNPSYEDNREADIPGSTEPDLATDTVLDGSLESEQ